jgi:hypothetical protein
MRPMIQKLGPRSGDRAHVADVVGGRWPSRPTSWIWREIHGEGAELNDVREPNILWNAERGRAMLIDLERSRLLRPGSLQPFQELSPNRKRKQPLGDDKDHQRRRRLRSFICEGLPHLLEKVRLVVYLPKEFVAKLTSYNSLLLSLSITVPVTRVSPAKKFSAKQLRESSVASLTSFLIEPRIVEACYRKKSFSGQIRELGSFAQYFVGGK